MSARLLVLWGTPSDPEAFERHYRDVHLPLARQLPGLRSYVLGHDAAAIRGEPYYLVAELEWDSMDDLRAAFASPPGRATAADTEHMRQWAEVRSLVFTTTDETPPPR